MKPTFSNYTIQNENALVFESSETSVARYINNETGEKGMF